MATVELTNNELFFIWDSLNDRRINAIDLINSEVGLDADTVEHLDSVAAHASLIQDIIFAAMED